tara:strand:+ start:495 stop:1154 length:660 start_codon:yes stop_codon:yes gene_type:complete
MNKIFFYFITLFSCLALLSCQKTEYKTDDNDNKSYINNFDLVQENSSNNTSIRIKSPKAIIDSSKNYIEIINSNIRILNNNKPEVTITAGTSFLNNSKNYISFYNNVYISLLDSNNTYIKTNSFGWDVDSSIIQLENTMDINFKNTNIISSNGIYNIDSGILNLDNIKFNRSIIGPNGYSHYQIKITSDHAKWLKNDNSIEFTSSNEQVRSTIDFLDIK